MNEYLEDIKQAIEKVKGEYRTWRDWEYIAKKLEEYHPNKRKEALKMKESVFCYEFYHQFRLLMENERYEGLILNAEITKCYFDSVEANTSYQIYYPDFVLHSGQDKGNRQEVVIEVKTSERIKQNKSDYNLNTDIEKLINFTKEGSLKYQKGVFIAINMSTEELKQQIDVDRFKEKENKKRIYLIGTCGGDFVTLEDICPSQK